MSDAFNPVLAVLRVRDALQGIDGYNLDAEVADCEALLCFLYASRAPEALSPEERKRAGKAARQARWRASRASTAASTVDVGVDAATSTKRLHAIPATASRASESSSEISQSSLTLRSISESQKEEIQSARGVDAVDASPASTKTSTAKARRWTRFPADYVPTAADRALAAAEGVDFDREFAKLLDWEYTKPKSDPVACLRTWMRNAAAYAPGGARVVNGKDMSRPQARLLTHAEHAVMAAAQVLPDWAKD